MIMEFCDHSQVIEGGGGVPVYDHGVLYPLTGYIGGGVPLYDHGVL